MNLNKEMAKRVRTRRKKSGHTQESVAEMLGMTRVNYVNMEAGTQSWMPMHIYNLCRIFRCRPTNLFPKITPVRLKSKVTKKRIIAKAKICYSKI